MSSPNHSLGGGGADAGPPTDFRAGSHLSGTRLPRGRAEPPTPTPVGLLQRLLGSSAAERRSAEATLGAGIAVLQLRVVSAVGAVTEREALMSPAIAPHFVVEASVSARAGSGSEQRGGSPCP